MRMDPSTSVKKLSLAACALAVAATVGTTHAEETTAVVAGSGAVPPAGLPGEVSGSGLLLAPHLTGTDGMFIAVVEV